GGNILTTESSDRKYSHKKRKLNGDAISVSEHKFIFIFVTHYARQVKKSGRWWGGRQFRHARAGFQAPAPSSEHSLIIQFMSQGERGVS
uniref:Uncharacterized protein n=2 Tax=Aegilops tauschii subsp. strangulata TaxID=200361 RepID=A0A453PZY0_AEGTS